MPSGPRGPVDLPARPLAGLRSLPGLGRCLLEPVPDIDGWLVRLIRHDDQPTPRVVLDFADPASDAVRQRALPVRRWARGGASGAEHIGGYGESDRLHAPRGEVERVAGDDN